MYAAQEYNRNLSGDVDLKQYQEILNPKQDGVIGAISIPKIGLEPTPILHGDHSKALNTGIGHAPQSSLPVGGVGTHAYLSGHSGRANHSLFTDLHLIRTNDEIIIHQFEQELQYRVIKKEIRTPQGQLNFKINPQRDLITLVTCYPPGVNSHRLLVTAERILGNNSTAKMDNEFSIPSYLYGYLALGCGLLTLFGGWGWYRYYKC